MLAGSHSTLHVSSVGPHLLMSIVTCYRSLELAARRLGRAGGSSVVTVCLVEGRDLLAMDEEGTSDPYCKFRWAHRSKLNLRGERRIFYRLANERYKTKTVYESLNPKWQEQFELYLYEDQGQELDITVWDRDQRSKDDFMGRYTNTEHKIQTIVYFLTFSHHQMRSISPRTNT